MANKLTDEKRAEMFAAWCEKQSKRFVAQKCNVSITTVGRWKIKDKWVERYAKIQQKATDKVDTQIVKMKARHAKYGQVLQQMFHRSFMKNGVLDMVAVKKLDKKDLIKALEAGVKMERDALGEADKIIVQDYENKTPVELQAILKELEQKEQDLKG